MKNIFENSKTIQEKREILKKLSRPLKEVAKTQGNETLNDAIKAVYSQSGHTELKTMKQWNKEGKRVKKGQTALCLWGKPKKRKDATGNEENETFYPLCFVFSNLQVH